MGQVAITYRIMPEGSEIDLGKVKKEIKAKIPKHANIRAMDEKPMAFGLKAIETMIVVEDAEGVVDSIEETLRSIEGVSSVEVTNMGRLI